MTPASGQQQPTTKGEIRAARKAARAAGKAWTPTTIEYDGGGLHTVRTRTAREEQTYSARMERWARSQEDAR